MNIYKVVISTRANLTVVYIKQDQNIRIYLILYVDNMLITSNSMKGILEVKRLLASEFEMKDLGEVKAILGMQINKRELGCIELHQSSYMNKVMVRYNMQSSKPASTLVR